MASAIAEVSRESEILESHKKFLENANGNLRALHEAGIARFEMLKFPHPKHEMYTFVNTHELATTVFTRIDEATGDPATVSKHIYPSASNSVLVFVDGVYQESLSNTSALPDTVNVSTLDEALKDASIQSALLESAQEENDVFASLNTAFMPNGVFLDVASNVQLDAPIQILFFSKGQSQPVVAHPRLLVRAGAGSEIKCMVKFAGEGSRYLVNAVQDFFLEDNASVIFSQFQNDPADAWHCSKLRVNQKRDSRFFAVNAASGSHLARTHYEMRLKEEGGELSLGNVAVLENEEQAHNFVRIHHEAPHCTSHQHFKNVIDDKGRASVDGTVIVNQGAQLTSSDQLINNLMLSDDAHADNKPNLMIYADDVKCAHGATVGQIDEDHLFYLKTRGLEAGLARQLLTTSFVESILEQVRFPELAKELNSTLLKKLEA